MKSVLAFFLLLSTATAFFTPAALTTPATSLSAKKIGPKLQYAPCIPTKNIPKPGTATSGVCAGLAICIAVDKDGSIYALGDKCPPVNQPLSFGKVANGCIEDPVLGTKFNLKTGQVQGAWCPSGIGKLLGGLFEPSGVNTYPVKKQGANLCVQVDVNAKLAFEQQYWSGVLDAQGKANGKYY
ncbi:hypothetical protein TrCOL_g2520 [Triparma columacea]|uniref:Rieske domain-containing protein n=1 Tax=Triparma columacea TaxID=722753 RepID=A0A9W7G5T8_9STRA|nr:hypothetical protein TrCOL_g2520 [Triparma columacea]